MKKYLIIGIIIIVMVLGFFTGTYMYKIKQIEIAKNNIQYEIIEDECTSMGEYGDIKEVISVNTKEEKTSPNCVVVLKTYHKKCGHLLEKKQIIENTKVNLTEEEFRNYFPEWELQRFTPSEIVLYKEVDGFCNEHYLLKEKDGSVAVYSLDINNNETLIETTNIPTKYLPEEDIEKIEKGIQVNTKKELNKALEDYE